MTRTLLLRPDSPLIFRTGRPFGAAGTVGDAGYGFPMPATTAGALRAAWCDAAGPVHQPRDKVLMHIHVRGPLRCSVVRGEPTLWMPQPADALYYTHGERQLADRVARLQPGSLEAGAGCDAPFGLQPLLPPLQAKFVDGPKWWNLAAMQAWLSQHAPLKDKLAAHKVQGHVAVDHRTHVSIDTGSSLANDGGLFTSTGLDFTAPAAQAGVRFTRPAR